MALNDQLSIWSIACSNHVYASLALFYDSPFQKIPEATGITVRQAVETYVLQDKRVVSYDLKGWPSNEVCAK